MNPTLKRVLTVIAGLVTGMIVVGLVEQLGMMIYPPPADLDINNPEMMSAYVKSAPIGSLLFVVLAWAVGAFAGTAVSSLIDRSYGRTAAYMIGGILMIAGIMNMVMIPHPLWFWVSVLVFIPSALLGYRVVERAKG